VPLQVYSNMAGRRAKHAVREALRHAVPTIAAHSGRPERPRLHPAGRPLCEVIGRASPMRLADQPTAQPVTCVRCLVYTSAIRPAKGALIDDQQF
jgi:hypothetical protein